MASRTLITLALPGRLAISSQGATAQSFFDDIESYNSGTNLDGQGGWRGWDGISPGLTTVSTDFAFDGIEICVEKVVGTGFGTRVVTGVVTGVVT